MNWTVTNAVSLRDLIKKNPAFIAVLEQAAPKCEGDTLEKRAVSGAERQGWQNCIAKIKAMMEDPTRNATDPQFVPVDVEKP